MCAYLSQHVLRVGGVRRHRLDLLDGDLATGVRIVRGCHHAIRASPDALEVLVTAVDFEGRARDVVQLCVAALNLRLRSAAHGVWRGGLRRERPSGQGLDFYPRTGGGFGSVLSCTLELTRIRTMVQLFETELWRQFCRVQSHLRTKTNDPIDPEAEIPSLESVKAGAFCLVAHAVNAQELQHERDIMVSK